MKFTIEADAECLKECHTLDGKWSKDKLDQAAKARYVEATRVVKRLRQAAKKM